MRRRKAPATTAQALWDNGHLTPATSTQDSVDQVAWCVL